VVRLRICAAGAAEPARRDQRRQGRADRLDRADIPQLVLLSIIIVGQKVEGAASDKRSSDTYNDAEAILHEAIQIQEHLAAQDKVLTDLIEKLQPPRPA